MPALLRSGRFWSLLLPLALVAGYLLWQQARGPLVPGYRLEARPLVQRVVASGEVDSPSLAQVGSEITGVVAARHVREGDRVVAGQLLVTLRDDEQQARVREAEAALAQLAESARPQAAAAWQAARADHAQAVRERQRRETLSERKLVSREVLEQARRDEVAARAALDRARLALAAVAEDGSETRAAAERLAAARVALARTRLHAEVDGVVQSRAVEPGDLVQPGRTLLTIAREGLREIRLPLDEKNLAPVAPGQPATVIADAWPDRPLRARVAWLDPRVDSSRGTLDVHLELLETADFLRQGMTVSVTIETARRAEALVLPRDALLEGAPPRALRLDDDGRAQPATLRLGLAGSAAVEVLDGLAVGDRVLAAPVEPGTRVRFAPRPLPWPDEAE